MSHETNFMTKTTVTAPKSPMGSVEAFAKEVKEILDAMGGEDGLRKRTNAKKVRERLIGC